MRHRSRARYGRRLSPLPVALLVVAGLTLAAVVFAAVKMLTAPRPTVALAAPFDVVGRNAPLVVEVRDDKGLRAVRVTVQQAGEERLVVDQAYDPPRREVRLRWVPAQDESFRLQEGPGTLVVWARNDSWGNFGRGRTTRLEKAFTARTVPPRLEVLTTQHYVNQGGCDMVVYRASPASAQSGVEVGERFFRGFPMPGGQQDEHFCIFCLPHDTPADAAIRLQARDEAHNESLTTFWVKVFPRAFRSRELALDEAFLRKVVPEIMSQTSSLQDRGGLLENYLQINRELREANNRRLAELTASSRPEFLWSRPFRQLGGSQVEAQFADHRTYVYQGRQVDTQTHLGFDLATTARAPVTASNDGVVVLAEYLGIYGNTVVIDHGYGLMSLYGHLSGFGVRKGDGVRQGQEIGTTGATGLAGGDHLHFSMLYQDVQVDAREWWDPHWIHDRLAVKLAQFGRAAGPGGMAASPSPQAGASAPVKPAGGS